MPDRIPVYTALRAGDQTLVRGYIIKCKLLNKGKYYICPEVRYINFTPQENGDPCQGSFEMGPFYEILPNTIRRVL